VPHRRHDAILADGRFLPTHALAHSVE
jgi:hypothetical protein